MTIDFSKQITIKTAVAALSASFTELTITYRAAQLIAHNFHNLAKGATFFEDHEFLGELYGTYESAYDALIERTLGLTGSVDIIGINKKACEIAASVPVDGKSNEDMFSVILSIEKTLCGLIKTSVPGSTDGTQNLLQGLSDESEARQYKLLRRLM